MIVYEQGRKVAPLLGPQLSRGGPFAPGERVRFAVPVCNERQVELERVTMTFCSDQPNARFDPESVEIASLPGGSSTTIEGELVVPELHVSTGTARIWGVLKHPLVGVLQTAQAEVQVRSRAIVHASCDEHVLVLENAGTAGAIINLDADVPLPSDWENPLTLDAGARRDLPLPRDPLGAIRCIDATTNERSVVLDRRRALQPPMLSAEGRGPDKGVRVGDLLPVQIDVLNSGGPAYHAQVTLDLPPGVVPIDGYTTRNDVTLLDQDVKREDGRVTFVLGCIEPHATAHLAAAFRVQTLESEVDVLVFRGEVAGGKVPSPFKFGVRATRLPRLAGHDTYWSPLEEDDQGFIHTSLTITNVHGDAVEGTLALRADGAQIESVTRDGHELELGSDAVEYGTLVDFGPLAARSRVTLDVIASRLPGRRELCFDARIVAHGRTMQLAQIAQELAAEPRPTLTLRAQREPRVRVGMPCLLEIALVNHGTDALRGPRLRPVTSDGVEIHLPYKTDESGWARLADLAPLGGRTGFPVILQLTKPPTGDEIEVALEIDADNTPITRSNALTIATPSSPAIVVSEPELREVGKRGLVEVRVRVANRSDGVARDLWLTTRAEDRPVPYTATLDGHSVDERGRGGSILIEGLPLGDLPPNSQRDVAWYAAPDAQRYRTEITVHAEPKIKRVVDGGIEITDQGWFTTEPLPAQPVDETLPLAGVSPTSDAKSSVLDVQVADAEAGALESNPDVRALNSASTQTIDVHDGAQQMLEDPPAPLRAAQQSALEGKIDQRDVMSEPLREAAPRTGGQAGELNALFDRIGFGSQRESLAPPPVSESPAIAIDKEIAEPVSLDESAGVAAQDALDDRADVPSRGEENASALYEAPNEPSALSESLDVHPTEEPTAGQESAQEPQAHTVTHDQDASSSPATGSKDDLGIAIVALIHGLHTVESLWDTALVQAVVMRLIGPHDLVEQRKMTVAERVRDLLPNEITENDIARWFADLLAQWSDGEPSARADEEALAQLQRCAAPREYAEIFDDYLAEIEEIFPLRGPEPYLQQLRSLRVPRVAEALAHLMEAVT